MVREDDNILQGIIFTQLKVSVDWEIYLCFPTALVCLQSFQRNLSFMLREQAILLHLLTSIICALNYINFNCARARTRSQQRNFFVFIVHLAGSGTDELLFQNVFYHLYLSILID
jgi:uncharacterized membrane protein